VIHRKKGKKGDRFIFEVTRVPTRAKTGGDKPAPVRLLALDDNILKGREERSGVRSEWH
jgi:hypothetical protein